MSGAAALPPRGLPGALPPGERILWQGAPDAAALARSAFHARQVALYFALLTVLAFAVGRTPLAAIATAVGGCVAVALLTFLGWFAARTSVYTLTDRRLVLRIGMALPTSINLPLAKIAAIDLSERGDVAVRLSETPPLGWLVLWPHARPWRLSRPEPMLRCLPDAAAVATLIARATLGESTAPVRITPIVPTAPARAPEACAA